MVRPRDDASIRQERGAPALAGEEVYVVGGANSAGQAALHLAKFAARVTLLVRGQSLEPACPTT